MGMSSGDVPNEYGGNQDHSEVGSRVRQRLSHKVETIVPKPAAANGPGVLATQYLRFSRI